MTKTSWELLARDCLHEALHTYPQMEREYWRNAELHSNMDRVTEILTAVIACMEGEGVDALTAQRIIRSSWQVMFASTLREVDRLPAAEKD